MGYSPGGKESDTTERLSTGALQGKLDKATCEQDRELGLRPSCENLEKMFDDIEAPLFSSVRWGQDYFFPLELLFGSKKITAVLVLSLGDQTVSKDWCVFFFTWADWGEMCCEEMGVKRGRLQDPGKARGEES